MHWFCRTTYPRLRPTRCLSLPVPIHRRAWATNPSLHQRTVERGGVPPKGRWIVGTVADLGRLRQGSPMIRGYRSPINASFQMCSPTVLFACERAVGQPASFSRLSSTDHFPGVGLVGGTILISAAALLPEALACVGTYEALSRGSAEPRQMCGSAPKPHVV
jgi:hypothetical protein